MKVLIFYILYIKMMLEQEDNDLEIEEDKKQLNPAFCAAMEFEFKEILYYEREYNLSKKPL